MKFEQNSLYTDHIVKKEPMGQKYLTSIHYDEEYETMRA
jgi:hypothetical protein